MNKMNWFRFLLASCLLLLISQQSIAQSSRPLMTPKEPSRAGYTGILVNSEARMPFSDAHIFALDQNLEILVHTKTLSERGPESGRFQLLDLPPNIKVIIVGFHESQKTNIAIKEINTQPGYHDLKSIYTVAGSFQSAEFSLINNLITMKYNDRMLTIADLLLLKLKNK